MIETFRAMRQLRDLRDLIFDAKYQGAWLYHPCEVLAFEWMRLVSSQIQSINYDPTDFLKDLESFASAVRRIEGIEGGRVQALETLVGLAVRDINTSAVSQNAAGPGVNEYRVQDESMNANARSKSTTKLLKAAAPASSSSSVATAKKLKSGNGMADLFQGAIAAIEGCDSSETETFPPSGRAAVEVAADRVSHVFRSLYEQGSQHGSELVAQCRKRKLRQIKEQSASNLGNSSVSSLQQKRLQQKDSQVPPKVISKEKAAPPPPAPQPRPQEILSTAKKINGASKGGIASKRGRGDDSQCDIKTSIVLKKKMKPATTTGDRPAVAIPDWLVVDSARTDMSSLSKSNPQLPVPADRNSTRNNSDTHDGSSSSDGSGGPVSAGASRFTGVYPLIGAGGSGKGSMNVEYSARVELLGRDVDLGLFPSEEGAARAHDRALMRAIGPSNCRTCDLNFPVSEYSCEPLSRFMEFDEKLKTQLFVTAWHGLKPCDFGFLLVRGMGQGQPSVLQTQAQKMAQFSAGPGAVKAIVPGDQSKRQKISQTQEPQWSGDKVPVLAAGTGASSLPAPSSSSSSSSSLKSRIVMNGEIERSRVPPSPFGAVISVANASSAATSSNRGGRGGRGKGRGFKAEKLSVQRAVYLGPGKHPMPGRCLLGFLGGSRLVSGVTFVKRLPDGIFTGVVACELPRELSDSDRELLLPYSEVIEDERRGRSEVDAAEESAMVTDAVAVPVDPLVGSEDHADSEMFSVTAPAVKGVPAAGSMVEEPMEDHVEGEVEGVVPLPGGASVGTSLRISDVPSPPTPSLPPGRPVLAEGAGCPATHPLDSSGRSSVAPIAAISDATESSVRPNQGSEREGAGAGTLGNTHPPGVVTTFKDGGYASPLASPRGLWGGNPSLPLSPRPVTLRDLIFPPAADAVCRGSEQGPLNSPPDPDPGLSFTPCPPECGTSSPTDDNESRVPSAVLPAVLKSPFVSRSREGDRPPGPQKGVTEDSAECFREQEAAVAILNCETERDRAGNALLPSRGGNLLVPSVDRETDSTSVSTPKRDDKRTRDRDEGSPRKRARDASHSTGGEERVPAQEGSPTPGDLQSPLEQSSRVRGVLLEGQVSERNLSGEQAALQPEAQRKAMERTIQHAAPAAESKRGQGDNEEYTPHQSEPTSLFQICNYKPQAQQADVASPDDANRRGRRSSTANTSSALEIFSPNIEKHRVNEIPPWVCRVLGEEVLRLQLCVADCAADPPASDPGGGYAHYIRGEKRLGWERSLEAREGAAEALRELRSKIVGVLSAGQEGSEGLSTLSPAVMFCGVQIAGTDSSTDGCDPSNPSSVTKYVATDIFASGPRFFGLFSSPLEAALLREQLLNRQGKLLKKKKAPATAKDRENFDVSEWAMVLELSALVEGFVRCHGLL